MRSPGNENGDPAAVRKSEIWSNIQIENSSEKRRPSNFWHEFYGR